MDGRVEELRKKLDRALKETAEAAVALGLGDGTLQEVPHYSAIELRAHELGQQLSRRIQERQMGKLVAGASLSGKCPDCGNRCELIPRKGQIGSIDGQVELVELEGYCPFCRRAFFPDAGNAGA